MGTVVHIIIIALIAGLIIWIVASAGRRKAVPADETEDTEGTLPPSAEPAYLRMKRIAIFSVASLVIMAISGVIFFKTYKGNNPISEILGKGNQTGKIMEIEGKQEVTLNFPLATGDGKTASSSLNNVQNIPPNVNAIYQKISPSVVVIYVYNEKNQLRGRGSGFFINQRGDIITCHHVLRGATSAKIKTPRGGEYEIQSILAEDVANDLAMASVKIDPAEVSPLQVSNTIPDVGEKVVVLGSPLGLDQTVSDGIVSAVRTINSTGKFLQITAPISPGSSGSPVVNMRGEVIGVASGALVGNNAQSLNFCTAGDKVAALSPGRGGYSLGRMDHPEWEVARNKQLKEQQERQQRIAEITKLNGEASIRMNAHDYDGAFKLYESCLYHCRQLGDNQCSAVFLNNMGVAMYRAGRREEAQKYYQEALAARNSARN